MSKIFLSYAEEDEAVGKGLARALVERGYAVYWWEDPALPRGRFQDDIEERIYGADRFVAVLSDHYVRSIWCRRERNMAIHLENGGRAGFIVVVRADSVNELWPGMLSEYSHTSVQPGDWSATIDTLAPTIGPPSVSTAPAASSATASGSVRPATEVAPRPSGQLPKFRNRDEELDHIVDQLMTDGGIDVWLVSAPPQLGKSWFLDELASRVRARKPDCRVSVLDLSGASTALRSEPVRLLTHLLELETPLRQTGAEPGDSDLNRVTAEISRRRRPQLYMLDTGDLLEGDAPERLRRYLDEVFGRLAASGSNTRLRIVISGRRVDRWRPLSNVRSKKLRLTEFTEGVVRTALSDIAGVNHRLGPERLNALTQRLHGLCEGLPALLVDTLERIDEYQFVGVDGDAWWREAFEDVVRPYVANHVLSTDSLFPAGGQSLASKKAPIDVGLRMLAPYRIVTVSNLIFLSGRRDELRGLAPAQLSTLFDALIETALVLPVQARPWYEIYPPIRRLLYRYYVTKDADREVVHRLARDYYLGFRGRTHSGSEQPVRLIECIWHEAMRRSTGVTTDGFDSLPAFAAKVTGEFLLGSTYSSSELNRCTAELLDDDRELQLVLGAEPGLFDVLRGNIEAAIQGGGG